MVAMTLHLFGGVVGVGRVYGLISRTKLSSQRAEGPIKQCEAFKPRLDDLAAPNVGWLPRRKTRCVGRSSTVSQNTIVVNFEAFSRL
jgi:hypothetical protein